MPRTVALRAITRTRTAKAREVGTAWLLTDMLSEAGKGSLGTHIEEFFAEGHEAVAVVC